MKEMKTVDAVGQILCHDITQIIKGVTKDAVFRKGHVITEEDIPDILQTGVTGIALSGTVLRADDPVQKMKQLINTVNHE